MPTPTASPASSSNEAAVMTEVVSAPPSSSMVSSSPTAVNNEDELTAHPPIDSDVAMEDTTDVTNDSSLSPIQLHSFNDIKNDDDAEMTPREDDAAAVHPMENPTAVMENDDLESSSPAPPSEQSANTPSPTPPREDDNKEESKDMLLLDDCMEEEILPKAADEEMKQSDTVPPSAEQRRRDDNHLDDTLDKLQHSISVAILAFRKDEQRDKENNEPKEEAGSTTNDNDGSAYGKLREAAMEAYQTLVEYGASLDLSLEMMSPLNKRRREKLEKIGR